MNVTVITVVLLSMTGLMLFHVGGDPISIFLVCLPVAMVALLKRTDIRQKELRWLLFLVIYILVNVVSNTGNTKAISVCYSLLFVYFFAAIYSNIKFLTLEGYITAIKAVILLYAANLIVAQVLVRLHIHNDFLNGIFHSDIDERSGKVRYFSFSSEPSYAAFIVTVSYYAYYRLSRLSYARPSPFYLILILYCVHFYKSIYGILLAAIIIMIHIINFKRFSQKALAVACIVIALVVVTSVKTRKQGRLHDLTQFALKGKFDLDDLNMIDSSTWMRVAPPIDYLYEVKFSDPQFWFGHGADSSTGYFTDRFYENRFGEDSKIRLGFLPGFLYDYGIAGMLIVLIFSYKVGMPQLLSFESLVVLMLLFNASFNTQLFWYVIVTFAALKYYTLDKKQPGLNIRREAMATV